MYVDDRDATVPTDPITSVRIGGTGGTCPAPLGAYSVTHNSAKMHQNTSFSHQKFSGRGHSPLPRPLPMKRGHPCPYPTPREHTTTRSWLRHWIPYTAWPTCTDAHISRVSGFFIPLPFFAPWLIHPSDWPSVWTIRLSRWIIGGSRSWS